MTPIRPGRAAGSGRARRPRPRRGRGGRRRSGRSTRRPPPAPSRRPAARRARGVGPDHEVARAGTDLELVEEVVAVLRGRSTVDVEQQRHRARRGLGEPRRGTRSTRRPRPRRGRWSSARSGASATSARKESPKLGHVTLLAVATDRELARRRRVAPAERQRRPVGWTSTPVTGALAAEQVGHDRGSIAVGLGSSSTSRVVPRSSSPVTNPPGTGRGPAGPTAGDPAGRRGRGDRSGRAGSRPRASPPRGCGHPRPAEGVVEPRHEVPSPVRRRPPTTTRPSDPR
jgi:hypothetical protein